MLYVCFKILYQYPETNLIASHQDDSETKRKEIDTH